MPARGMGVLAISVLSVLILAHQGVTTATEGVTTEGVTTEGVTGVVAVEYVVQFNDSDQNTYMESFHQFLQSGDAGQVTVQFCDDFVAGGQQCLGKIVHGAGFNLLLISGNLNDSTLKLLRNQSGVVSVVEGVIMELTGSCHSQGTFLKQHEKDNGRDILKWFYLWNLDLTRGKDVENAFVYPAEAGQNVSVYLIDGRAEEAIKDFMPDRVKNVKSLCSSGLAPPCSESADVSGHATQVAGVVAGEQFGVAKQAKVLVIQAFNDDKLSTSSAVLAALNWILLDKKERDTASNYTHRSIVLLPFGPIHNDSWALINKVPPLKPMFELAAEAYAARDMLWVAGAGLKHDRSNACLIFPAGVAPDSVLTVASYYVTYSNDTKFHRDASVRKGQCVDVLAPGINIVTNFPDGTGGYVSGVSFAAAHAAGVAALYMGTYPHLTASEVLGKIKGNTYDYTTQIAEEEYEYLKQFEINITQWYINSDGEFVILRSPECPIQL